MMANAVYLLRRRRLGIRAKAEAEAHPIFMQLPKINQLEEY